MRARLHGPDDRGRDRDDLVVRSAGPGPIGETPVTAELLTWPDQVFVMEPEHWMELRRRFPGAYDDARTECLHISDDYGFMAGDLVEMLVENLEGFIGAP